MLLKDMNADVIGCCYVLGVIWLALIICLPEYNNMQWHMHLKGGTTNLQAETSITAFVVQKVKKSLLQFKTKAGLLCCSG